MRFLVTLRSYTRSVTSKIESAFFFPLFLLGLINIYMFIPYFMKSAIWFPSPPVMVFSIFFLFLMAMWISIPIMGFRLNESLDMKRLLQFPISFPVLYASSTFSSFLDVSSLLPFTFLASLLNFFVQTGKPIGFLGIFLLCVVIFIFLQLAYQFVILVLYNVLPRFNPMKIIAIFLIAIVAMMVLLNLRIIKVPYGFSMFNDENLKYHAYLPTGAFGISFYEFWLGNLDLGYRFLLKSIAWTFPLLILNGFLTWATYRGVTLGIIRSSRHRKPSRHRVFSETIPALRWMNHPSLVLASMMLKTQLRDWHFVFYKMMPGIVTPTLILLIIRYHYTELNIDKQDPFFFWFTVSFLVMIIMLFLAQAFIFVGNIFGYDREAIAVILTVPLSEKTLLLGKNIFMFGLLSIDSAVISFLTLLFVSRIAVPLTFFCLMECLVIILIGLGNFSSIFYPYHVPFDKPTVSFQGTLIVTILSIATDTILLVAVSPIAVGFFYLIDKKLFLMLIPSVILAFGYSIALYYFMLDLSSKILPRYRETIFLNVKAP